MSQNLRFPCLVGQKSPLMTRMASNLVWRSDKLQSAGFCENFEINPNRNHNLNHNELTWGPVECHPRMLWLGLRLKSYDQRLADEYLPYSLHYIAFKIVKVKNFINQAVIFGKLPVRYPRLYKTNH